MEEESRQPEGDEPQRRREDEAVRRRRIIAEGVDYATAHDQEIDDWVASHIAAELRSRRGSAVDILATTGEITTGLRFELLDGYNQQSPSKRRWIDFLGTYYVHRPERGPIDGWLERTAARDRFEEAWQAVHAQADQQQLEAEELDRALKARQRIGGQVDDELGRRLLVAVAPDPYGAAARYAVDGLTTDALMQELAHRYRHGSPQVRSWTDQLVAWIYRRPEGGPGCLQETEG